MDNKILILGRIKEYYKFNTDAELANFLGIQRSTLSNWVKRDSIDYDLVFSKCKLIDKNWLLTGNGQMLKPNTQKTLTHASDVSDENIDSQDKYTDNIEEKQEKDKEISNPMTTDERIDALIRQNDILANAVQDIIKMTHETIAANQRQGETNQEIMKQLLSILEDSKKNSHAGGVRGVAIRAAGD